MTKPTEIDIEAFRQLGVYDFLTAKRAHHCWFCGRKAEDLEGVVAVKLQTFTHDKLRDAWIRGWDDARAMTEKHKKEDDK